LGNSENHQNPRVSPRVFPFLLLFCSLNCLCNSIWPSLPRAQIYMALGLIYFSSFYLCSTQGILRWLFFSNFYVSALRNLLLLTPFAFSDSVAFRQQFWLMNSLSSFDYINNTIVYTKASHQNHQDRFSWGLNGIVVLKTLTKL
jgi:hypothetical protein